MTAEISVPPRKIKVNKCDECGRKIRGNGFFMHKYIHDKNEEKRRFWAKIIKTKYCWLWIGSLTHNMSGYGWFYANGSPILAHRYSWILHGNNIPAHLFVLHNCDVQNCVNPEHLFLGTYKDNAMDMVRKGRNGQNTKPESYRKQKA